MRSMTARPLAMVALCLVGLVGASAASAAAPKLKRIGTAYGGVVGDGTRYVVFRSNPWKRTVPVRLTVLDTAKGTTRRLTLSAPCGTYSPSAAASGMLLVGADCLSAGSVQTLVDLATGAVRAIPAPAPALAQEGTFAWSSVGRFWLYGETCSYSPHCSPAFVNWRTGEYRVLYGAKLDRIPDLDSETLAKATRFVAYRGNDMILTLGTRTRTLAPCEVYCFPAPVHGDVVTWVDTPAFNPGNDRYSSASLYRIKSRRLYTWRRTDVPHLPHGQHILAAAGTAHRMVLVVGPLNSSGTPPRAVYAARLP